MENKARILIVDDTPLSLKMIGAMLARNYEVISAEPGQKALDIATGSNPPDLILLDVLMPKMDGYEVLARLKQDPKTSHIPVIFLTAMTKSIEESHGLELGAVDYLTKPVHVETLLARVRTHVELKRGRDLLRDQNNQLERQVEERTAHLRAALEEQQALNQQLADAQKHLLQADKMASLGQLAAGVAHEINNPVSFVNTNLGALERYVEAMFAIIAAADEAAARAPDSAEFATYQQVKKAKDFEFLREDMVQTLGESHEGLNRVRKIVADLKNFAHKGSDSLETFSIHDGIDSTLNIVWNDLKYKCTVDKQYASDLPEIEGYRSQLNQVFMNLLVNAGHAIAQSGKITIATERDGDEHIKIRISDTGSGIPPEHLARIFDPFFTTKPVGQGTGLGLSLAINIIHKHQGDIGCDSVVGQGTTFTIRLPIRQNRSLGSSGTSSTA